MFIFFKRNDNCIFLGIIPSFKLMVFSCRQTICFQQHLNELYIKFHNTIFYAYCWLIQHGKLGARRKFIAIELFVLQFSFMFFPYLCKFTNQGDFPNAQFLRPALFFHSISFSYI